MRPDFDVNVDKPPCIRLEILQNSRKNNILTIELITPPFSGRIAVSPRSTSARFAHGLLKRRSRSAADDLPFRTHNNQIARDLGALSAQGNNKHLFIMCQVGTGRLSGAAENSKKIFARAA